VLLCGPSLRGRITLYTLSLHPSVRLYVCMYVCPLPTVNSKTENRATFRLRGEVTHVRSNWQSKFEVKWSKIKVNGGEKRGPYIACLAYITYSLMSLSLRCLAGYCLLRLCLCDTMFVTIAALRPNGYSYWY